MLDRIFVLTLAASFLVLSSVAAADDGGPRFRRTSPRGSLGEANGALVIGIPGGRAWGIESELRPLPPAGTTLYVRLTVTDDDVREAFVRVAYYSSLAGRTRQLATSDSESVTAGRRALAAIALEPPPGAVGYRIRVLARLTVAGGRSADDAVTAVLRTLPIGARPLGPTYSRLLP